METTRRRDGQEAKARREGELSNCNARTGGKANRVGEDGVRMA